VSAKLSLVTEQEKQEARRKGLAIIDGKPHDPDEYELDAILYGLDHSKEIVAAYERRQAARAKQDSSTSR
jgi:hypothetical protein